MIIAESVFKRKQKCVAATITNNTKLMENVFMIIEEKKYGIQEVFDMLGEENLNSNEVHRQNRSNIIVDGFNVYSKSLRYMTFYQKGLKCACCGKLQLSGSARNLGCR